jgi:hypothetical protein
MVSQSWALIFSFGFTAVLSLIFSPARLLFFSLLCRLLVAYFIVQAPSQLFYFFSGEWI